MDSQFDTETICTFASTDVAGAHALLPSQFSDAVVLGNRNPDMPFRAIWITLRLGVLSLIPTPNGERQ